MAETLDFRGAQMDSRRSGGAAADDIVENHRMCVINRQGGEEPFSFDCILNRIKSLCCGLHPDVDPARVAQAVIVGSYDRITTTEIDELAAETSASLATKHADYSILAARIGVSSLHKNIASDFVEVMQALHDFKDNRGRSAALVSSELMAFVKEHRNALNDAIRHDRDFEFDYFGFKTLEKSYLLKMNRRVAERPQHMLMRVACGIHCGNLADALETYELMSLKFFIHATPTLFSAGTAVPQMCSCYLLTVKEDSVDGIFSTLRQCALISKNAGGIGLSISDVRAKGSYVRGTNGYAGGILPMLRVFNDTSRYVDQGGGKRNSSIAVYLEPWHADIFDFLDIRKNHGPHVAYASHLFTGLWIPDLFMDRVMSNGEYRHGPFNPSVPLPQADKYLCQFFADGCCALLIAIDVHMHEAPCTCD